MIHIENAEIERQQQPDQRPGDRAGVACALGSGIAPKTCSSAEEE
jgi:hypothetical protein